MPISTRRPCTAVSTLDPLKQLTLAEASELTGISVTCLYRLLDAGELRCVRVGRKGRGIRLRRVDLQQFLKPVDYRSTKFKYNRDFDRSPINPRSTRKAG